MKDYAGCIIVNGSKTTLYKKADNLLSKKEIIGIFPEGRYSNGIIRPFKTGIAKIAKSSKAKVLPIAIKSIGKIRHKSKLPKKIKSIIILIGKPINFNKDTVEGFTKKIEKNIKELHFAKNH